MSTIVLSQKAKYRIGWTGSVLNKGNSRFALKHTFQFLWDLKKKLKEIFETERLIDPVSPPKLEEPRLKESTFSPPWYFSKGYLQKEPTPIAYLLTELNETAQAKPIPGRSLLLRSLCAGKGTLKQNRKGLVYLDIDNHFISSLLPYLKAYGLVQPPYFHEFKIPDGAHIPVIPTREVLFHYLDHIENLGTEYSFEIEGLYSIEPKSWPEVDQVWFFKVKSAELEKLRRGYFLPARPGGHSFHIVVAVKPKIGKVKESLPMMRVNVAYTAA